MFVDRIDLNKGRPTKLFYQIVMLVVWIVSIILSMILLSQSLSDDWKEIGIFEWDLMWTLSAVAYAALNIINHLALIYYTILGVSERIIIFNEV